MVPPLQLGAGLGLAKDSGGGPSLDADAAAYAEARSLPATQTQRLSGFLSDVKRLGVDLRLVTLGRSEFLGRDGATHHAVIGPDATVDPAVTDDVSGINFPGVWGAKFEFDNPAPFTDDFIWQLVVAIPTANDTTYTLISGSPNSGGPFGPYLLHFSDGRISAACGNATTGTTLRNRAHAYGKSASGVPLLAMGQRRSGFVQPIKDIYSEFALAESAAMWNNGNKWRLGSQTSNHFPMDGHIALAMAGLGDLDRERVYKISAAIVRHNVAGISPPRWMGFVGDSMTVSASGGVNPAIGRSARWVSETSGWQGSFYDLEAIGGTSIAGQEAFFAKMMDWMAWVPDMPRTIVFWGGYNAVSPFDFASNATAEALADRYIAMAETAAAAGIQTVHWSRTVEGYIGTGGSVYAIIQHFNDYYRDQLAALDGNHIYYDHRLSYPISGGVGTHFDGDERNGAFFGDDIHCSQLGIDTLVDDFLTRFPNP